MMTRIAASALLALICCSLPAMADELREVVQVEGSHVLLGDLLYDAGAASERRVAFAPAPGESAMLALAEIRRVAAEAGLDAEISGPAHIRIERSGQIVPEDILHDALIDALGLSGPVGLRIGQGRLPLHVPLGSDPADVRIEAAHLDDRSGRFQAVAVTPLGEGREARTDLSGIAEPELMVPVAVRPLAPGETIRKADLDWNPMPLRRVNRTMITDLSMLIGMEPVRMLRQGQPLRLSDVRRPILVAKGALVTMTMRRGNMLLSATGKAMQDGSNGDIVRLQNIATGRTIEARVEGADRVSVLAPASSAVLLASGESS